MGPPAMQNNTSMKLGKHRILAPRKWYHAISIPPATATPLAVLMIHPAVTLTRADKTDSHYQALPDIDSQLDCTEHCLSNRLCIEM